jgi:hypothetical protein
MRLPMPQSYLRGARLILADPGHGPLLRKVTLWDRAVAAFASPDLRAVILFCALGAVLTMALIHMFPGWAEAATTAAQFF